MEARRPTTDAALANADWPVGETYEVVEAIDRVDLRGEAWLPLLGRPVTPVQDPQRGVLWIEHGRRGDWSAVADEERALRYDEQRVQLIVDASPSPRTRPPRVWSPGEHPGLADELVRLGQQDDAAIVRWVAEHGFVGIRADPGERHESIDEIRAALAHLAQARDLVHAIRTLSNEALRSETERLLSLPPGLFERVRSDASQPMSGEALRRAFNIPLPDPSIHWPGAGAHIQALYALSAVLHVPLERFLRVQTTIAPTDNGMRLQGVVAAVGPLATAYLHTLDEASWPAITYVESQLRISWRSPRRCGRCGTTFRPKRRDQKWCGARCRSAASKAAAAAAGRRPA